MPRRCPTEWNTGSACVTCEARKQGGRSLLLPGLPVRARLLPKGGDKPKGLNRMAERERVTLAAPGVEHTPPCVFHIPGLRRTGPPEVEHGLGTRAGPAPQDLPGPLPAEVVAGHRDHVHRMVLCA